MMNEKKKLGRPKDKTKPKDADSLLHVWLSPKAKEAFEYFRLYFRVEDYNADEHGIAPTALPLVRNADVMQRILTGGPVHAYSKNYLAIILRRKGCMNANELLRIEEGQDK